MTLSIKHVVVIQCEWETDDKKWACRAFDRFEVEGDKSPVGLRKQALANFEQNGWQLRNGAKNETRCPNCVGRRTNVREEPDKDFDPDEYARRFTKFMSINLTPREIAKLVNRAGSPTGVNWRRSAKKHMADAYAQRSLYGRPAKLGPVITEEVVDQLIRDYGTKQAKK